MFCLRIVPQDDLPINCQCPRFVLHVAIIYITSLCILPPLLLVHEHRSFINNTQTRAILSSAAPSPTRPSHLVSHRTRPHPLLFSPHPRSKTCYIIHMELFEGVNGAVMKLMIGLPLMISALSYNPWEVRRCWNRHDLIAHFAILRNESIVTAYPVRV